MKKKISLIVTALFCLSIFISPVYAATKDELQQQKDDAAAKKEAAQYQVDMTQNTIEGIRDRDQQGQRGDRQDQRPD